MLGRLEMSVDECIDAYNQLASNVFGSRAHNLLIDMKGKIQSKYSSKNLETSILRILHQRGLSKDTLLNDKIPRGCRT